MRRVLLIAAMMTAIAALTACDNAVKEEVSCTCAPDISDGQSAPPMKQFDPGSPSDKIYFAVDSARLTTEAQATLRLQAFWLKQYQVSTQIEGHADERGTREYNLALGERRANAVRAYLVVEGVPAHLLTTISYGKERPAVAGANETAWAQNRRAVTVPSSHISELTPHT